MSHCSNINLFIIFAFFAAKRFDLLFSMFSSGVMSQCFSIMVCNVPSRINGLLFKPNNILVKRKATMLGLSAVIESYQRNRKKSRWDWLTSIWRNACLISFHIENAKEFQTTLVKGTVQHTISHLEKVRQIVSGTHQTQLVFL